MYLDTLVKLTVGLAALMIVIRLLGKKELAQLTPYDFIYTLVLGGILEESLFDEKIKITHFLFAIALWAVLIFLIEKAAKQWNPVRILLKGEPAQLISNGELDMKKFNKHNLEMEQLRSALRKQGVFSLREVRDLFLEPGGDVTINKYADYEAVKNGDIQTEASDQEPTSLLIDEGEVKDDILTTVGKDRTWLITNLSEQGYTNLKNIAYCDWSETEGFFVRLYE
ncbi:DUF421 domain-containing protein [Psychrobacillus sp. NEAU-3TGS]|uniref:DUF421 domain-containing protein n=1 Tax=Psychrobacillus sp. NEAU-3TGS TaxID=2995412 RepID=UPI002495A8C3|nr:DUF421 domain-containing protein [Psychrobacillus sp. NEAU-3TGS]MDI2589344.1 DUF421 domain-containing protein [Psychrobacillus sp. NEAU-3TGS]